MSLLTAALVVWGFSHTVDQNLFHPAVRRPAILWVHGAAFSAWMLFYILQSALVRTRNLGLHRTLGWFGAALGAFMVPLGIATAIVMARFDARALHQPGREAFLIIPFYAITVFASAFGLAVIWRKKAPFHRRLIFIATCSLLSAAFARIDHLVNHGHFYICVDAVILLGVVHDLLANRRVHSVYLTALPLLAITQIFVTYTWMSNSWWWLRIAHAILG
jgi:hypothetical protein